jgi:hypothetical protein
MPMCIPMTKLGVGASSVALPPASTVELGRSRPLQASEIAIPKISRWSSPPWPRADKLGQPPQLVRPVMLARVCSGRSRFASEVTPTSALMFFSRRWWGGERLGGSRRRARCSRLCCPQPHSCGGETSPHSSCSERSSPSASSGPCSCRRASAIRRYGQASPAWPRLRSRLLNDHGGSQARRGGGRAAAARRELLAHRYLRAAADSGPGRRGLRDRPASAAPGRRGAACQLRQPRRERCSASPIR